jgi:phage-related protein
MATFTWTPSKGAKQKSNPKKKKIAFGDGYEQRISWGLNRDLKTWELTFDNRNNTERDQIVAFLEARGGTEAFDWTPPIGDSGKYVCEEWSAALDCGMATFPLEFRQVIA